jgi:hypothetical protein
MRVLLPNRPGGAFGYITDGWLNAFRSRGLVSRYDGNEATWNSFQPDLYLGCSGHKQVIPKNRKAKVAIHVNPYGPVDMGSINEEQQAINWTIAQKPDAVYGYGFETDRIAWSYWTQKAKIPWVPMPTAADAVIFNQIQDTNAREHDVVYLGGRWQYKGITIDQYLKPILDDKQVNYKLYGWGDWYPGVCSGILPEDRANQFLNSGKISPCISERHTQQYGIDIPERCWKVAACGTLAIHDPVAVIRDHFKTCVVAENAQAMHELVLHFLKEDEARRNLAKQQQEEVLASHTYHHRLANLLRELGFTTEAENMLNG